MSIRQIRQIVVHVDETTSSQSRIELAAQLASRTKADLQGVFQRSRFVDELLPGEVMTYMPPVALDSFISDHEREVTKVAEASRMRFEAACADAALASSWSEIEGSTPDPLLHLVRRTDLTMVGPSIRSAFGLNQMSAGKLALEAGGPVVIVRAEEPSRTIGERILVAWKGNRESARALHDAWPLLIQAKSVCIVMIRPPTDIGADSALQRHLEHHGVDAEIVIDDLGDVAAGSMLRRHAEGMQADLMVMGLYGRPRFSEILFGGVTQEFLEDPPTPLLVSH